MVKLLAFILLLGSALLSGKAFTQDQAPLVFSDFFSPNGDGKNDYFAIQNLDQYPDNTLKVYSRWGDLVFEAAPYTGNWNGTSNNGGIISNKLAEGVYYYIFEDLSEKRTYTGTVTLKR